MKRSLLVALRDMVLVPTVAALALCAARQAAAVNLQVGDATAGPGESADICVYMGDSGGNVAGVQMNLTWDGSCATVNRGDGGSARCKSNPATGKNVQTSVGQRPCGNDPNCLTAFLLSISDPSPIPDGALFCCSFTLSSRPPDLTCPIGISNVIAAEPGGTRVTVYPRGGTLYVSGGGSGRGGQALREGGGGQQQPVAIESGGSAPQAPAGQAPAAPGRAPGGIAPQVPAGEAPEGQAPAGQAPAWQTPSGEPTLEPAATQAAQATATPPRTPGVGATPTPRAATPRAATPGAQVTGTPATQQSPTAPPKGTPTAMPRKTKK